MDKFSICSQLEEDKSRFLVQVRYWEHKDFVQFLYEFKQRHDTTYDIPNVKEVLESCDIRQLKEWTILLVQNCDSLEQLRFPTSSQEIH